MSHRAWPALLPLEVDGDDGPCGAGGPEHSGSSQPQQQQQRAPCHLRASGRGRGARLLTRLLPFSFLEMMEARSRGHASPLAANGQSPSSGSQSPVVPAGAVSTGSSSPGTPQPAPQLPLNAAPPSSVPPVPPSEALPPPACPSAPAPRRSIISRLFGTSPATEAAPPPPGRPWSCPSQTGPRPPGPPSQVGPWISERSTLLPACPSPVGTSQVGLAWGWGQ